MAKAIAVASGKGGVGKTALVANLGISLARNGKRVVMVDVDLDMSNLELMLGIEGKPLTLQDVLSGDIEVGDAIYDIWDGAKFIPAGLRQARYRRVNPETLAKTLRKIKSFGDLILLDCPAGLGRDAIACFSACDEVLLITTPERMAVASALKAKMVAERMGAKVVGVVVNMSRGNSVEMSNKEIESIIKCNVLARIPEDDKMRKMAFLGKPIIKHSSKNKFSKEIEKLSTKIASVTYISEDSNKK